MHDTAQAAHAKETIIVHLTDADATGPDLAGLLAASKLSDARLVRVATRAEALEELGRGAQVLIIDRDAAVNRDGHWRNIHELNPDAALLVIGGDDDRDGWLMALECEAQDFLRREGLSAQALERRLRFSLARSRQKAEARRRLAVLEDECARMTGMIGANPDGILVVDDEGLVIFVNLAARLLLGRPERELLGRPFGFPVLKDGVGELELERKGSDRAVAEMHVAEMAWGESKAYLISLRDVSDHRRRKLDQARRIRAEKLVTTISTEFVTLDAADTDVGIRDALKLLGEFCRVDRAVVYLFDEARRLLTNAYEWASTGVSAQVERGFTLAAEDLGWLMDRLTIFETALVASAAELPEQAEGERELLAERGVASLVAVALNRGGMRYGLLAFESVRRERMWSEEDIGLLKIVADTFCAALVRRDTEAAMRDEAWLMRQLTQNVQVGILAEDERGRVSLANQALCELFDAFTTPDALRGQEGADLMRSLANITAEPTRFTRRARDIATLRQVIRGEKIELKNGRILECDFMPLEQGGAPRGQLWFFRDATDMTKAVRRLETMVRRDLLTGLSKRHRFLEDLAVFLSKARAQRERVTLVLLDMDELRRVNAEEGFVIGDRVLKQAAVRLGEEAGEGALLGRISGDEFAVAASGASEPDGSGGPEGAAALARRLTERLNAPYETGGKDLRLTVSTGYSLYPDQAENAQQLLQKADKALERAKAEGKNRIRSA